LLPPVCSTVSGDRSHTTINMLGQTPVSCQMQVGKQQLPFLKKSILLQQRLFDFNNHLTIPGISRRRDNLRSSLLVVLIVKAAPTPDPVSTNIV